MPPATRSNLTVASQTTILGVLLQKIFEVIKFLRVENDLGSNSEDLSYRVCQIDCVRHESQVGNRSSKALVKTLSVVKSFELSA